MTVFASDPVAAASLSGRDRATLTVLLFALSSESSTSHDADAQISVCPVRALRIYIDRSASFRQSNSFSRATLCEGPGRIKK